ncbi:MAG: MFS transporter [Chlorobi bacterium]|nr:MFS transporter [Chlorobiota bacterium]
MKKNASISVIFVTVFIDLMGFGLLIPILPTFAGKQLHVSDFQIGIIIASFSFMQFLFNPVIGRLSDKFGRRKIILTTSVFTVSSYLIFSFSTSFYMLLISRIIAGIGGSNIGAAQAYIADVTDKKSRSKGMGVIGAAFGLGFVFGPLLGGLISKISYEAVGFSAAAFSFSAFLFAYFFLPESLKEKNVGKMNYRLVDFNAVLKVLRTPKLGFVVFLFFIIVFSIANIYGTFAILGFKIFHFSDPQIAYLYSIIGIVGAFVQGGFLRVLVKRFMDRRLIITGTVLMGIGLAALPYGTSFGNVALITIVISIGSGILQPILLSKVSKLTAESDQGTVLGINQSLASFARVLGPFWGGFAFEYIGYQFPFLTGALFAFFTLGLIILYLKE